MKFVNKSKRILALGSIKLIPTVETEINEKTQKVYRKQIGELTKKSILSEVTISNKGSNKSKSGKKSSKDK